MRGSPSLCYNRAMLPKVIRIYSANATFQQIAALRHNREKRQKQREFLVEGVRMINGARHYGWTVKAWIYAPERKLSQWASACLTQHPAAIHYELAAPLLAQLSNKAEPSELLALVAMPDEQLSKIPLDPNLLVVVFDRPSSPGNLGTLLRSCDALGANGLVITGHAVDLYDPETVSASVGSLFAVPAVRLQSPKELEPWLNEIQARVGPVQIVGSSAKATAWIDQHNWRQPTVLVIGNETSGMSAYYQQLCQTVVKIPMGGFATSLNVACAASILLYEIGRQRGILT